MILDIFLCVYHENDDKNDAAKMGAATSADIVKRCIT